MFKDNKNKNEEFEETSREKKEQEELNNQEEKKEEKEEKEEVKQEENSREKELEEENKKLKDSLMRTLAELENMLQRRQLTLNHKAHASLCDFALKNTLEAGVTEQPCIHAARTVEQIFY